MDKEAADKIILDSIKKLFGFALSRTSSISEAEELTSKITLEVYESLLKRHNIENVDGYIYKIAQNVYARSIDEAKRGAHLSLDEAILPAGEDFSHEMIKSDSYNLIRREIAYLSGLQRSIVVMHYYDRLKLDEIACSLQIPLGTVKWHLYEARNNLKKGMNLMREMGNLGIKPVKFEFMGHNGTPGSLGDTRDFLKKRLTQNIAYAAYHEPKTIKEIAEELGVSPLFVEDEVSTLEEYGFMDKVSGEKYLTNIFITRPSKEIAEKEHELFTKYAKILCEKYVPRLFDAMKNYDKNMIYVPNDDFNFLMWSVITFACGNKLHGDKDYNMDEFSVKRKDGGDYIAFATLEKDFEVSYDEKLYQTCGSMARESKKYPVKSWQLNTYYDDRIMSYVDNIYTDYEYLYEFFTGKIKKEESQIEKFQRLYDKGYLIYDGKKDIVNIVVIRNERNDSIHAAQFTKNLPGMTDELKAIGEELDQQIYDLNKNMYPQHMQKLLKACSSDCLSRNELRTRLLEQLVKDGTLKLPDEKQKHGLNTIMFSDRLP